MTCKEEGCSKHIFCRGWCNMHYSRWKRWGSPAITKKAGNKTYSGVGCSVVGCTRLVRTEQLCNMHYLRLFRGKEIGGAASLHAADGEGSLREGYIIVAKKRKHREVAENALGKPLPLGSVVHHLNLCRTDNRPLNLVVCQDESYHQLLHIRQRFFGYTGPPLPRAE